MIGNKKRTVGLEINDRQVRAVEMISSPKKNRLVSFGIEDIDPSKGNEGIVEAVRNLLSTMKVRRGTKINMSLPAKEVDMFWINRPRMNEVEHSLPTKREGEIVHDAYMISGKKFGGKKSAVIRIEARRDVVDKYQELIESAGFTCGCIDVEPFSLLNCFINNGPTVETKKTVALINVGAEVTNINVIHAGVLRYTKDVSVPWNKLFDKLPEGFDFDCNISEAVRKLENGQEIYDMWVRHSDLLINSIVKVFLDFENEQARKVDDIFLYGRMVLCKNFQFHLQRILGLRVTVWNPAMSVYIPKKNKKLQQFRNKAVALPIPIGLASYQACSLNLLPKIRARKNETGLNGKARKSFGKLYLGLIAAGALLLAFVPLSNNIKVENTNSASLRQDYTGMTKAEVNRILGEPFFKERVSSSSAYDQVWIFSLKSKAASTLEIKFKGNEVVEYLYK